MLQIRKNINIVYGFINISNLYDIRVKIKPQKDIYSVASFYIEAIDMSLL